MKVLIVESRPGLARLWSDHLQRQGCDVIVAGTEDEAIGILADGPVSVIVLDLTIETGSPLAVSDFASYRHPEARVIFVTNRTFFSDGSIFGLSANACAYIQPHTPPEDLAAMVEHYGQHGQRSA